MNAQSSEMFWTIGDHSSREVLLEYRLIFNPVSDGGVGQGEFCGAGLAETVGLGGFA
jgi:hypothetical protein